MSAHDPDTFDAPPGTEPLDTCDDGNDHYLDGLVNSEADPDATVRPIHTAPSAVHDARPARLDVLTQEQYELERARRTARERLDQEKADELEAKPALNIANVDDLPVSLSGAGTQLTQDDIEEAMKTRPVPLLDALRMARKEKTLPSLLRIGDSDNFVFYRGKSNSLAGESGQGKSSLGKLAHYQEAVEGRASLFIDREKDVVAFAESMVEFGDLSDEQAARIFYWSPTKSTDRLMPTILGFLTKYDIDLVTIDSVSRDISRFSPTASENSNDDVRRWYDACVEPIVRLGRTPLLIDHVVKPGTGSDGKPTDGGLYAKGAVAKREVITGCALMLRAVKKFSREQAGYAKAVNAKDNNGAHVEGSTVLEFAVTPGDEHSTYETRPSSETRDSAGDLVPTFLMERISRFVEEYDGLPSKNQVKTNVKGNTDALSNALERLIDARYLGTEPGPRNAKLLKVEQVYREGMPLGTPAPRVEVELAVRDGESIIVSSPIF